MGTQVTKTIKVAGMHCEACQKIIGRKLSKIMGVLQVKASFGGEVTIVADRSISVDEVKLALEGTDYKVS